MQVLGRRRLDGSTLIRVEEMQDGVVAFEDEDDAQTFATLLEADSASDVAIVRGDSHVLFRTVAEVSACVVLLRSGVDIPQPQQLAVSLRGQKSIEESLD